MLVPYVDNSHPQHPHHLECPRCGRHTIVTKAESYYVCLHCGWERDLSRDWPYGMEEVVSFIVTFLLLLLIL
jgi:ribosomal protein L37E